MKSISLVAILLGTVLAQAEGFGFEELKKGIDILQPLIRIFGEVKEYIGQNEEKNCVDSSSEELAEALLKEIKSVVEKMDQLMDATIGEPTCPEEAANGVYPLKPAHTTIPPFRVYCEKGGWIVIHRRFNGKLNFNRTWNEYREGFGDIQDEFWLGLEKLHQLTRTGSFELKLVLKAFDGVEKWSKFNGFLVADEFQQYRLDLNKFIAGNAGDRIFSHNGMKFSTPDRDNDTGDRHCAQLHSSGWWFKQCFDTNLNGLYGQHSPMALKEARMMIRRVQS